MHIPTQETALLQTHRSRCAIPVLALLLAALLPPASANAQQQPETLTLEYALQLARDHSPDYLAAANDIRLADWNVRAAYGDLLPGASVSGNLGYQAAGDQRFGVLTGSDLGIQSTTDYYTSSYGLNLNYSLSGSSLFAPGRERAARRATSAGIRSARSALESDVTVQYLAVRRAQDGVDLAEQELTRATENARLAAARVAVGAAIPLEQTQAEVERGRAEVALLTARNELRTQRLVLGQVIGRPLPEDVVLTTEFDVQDVPWELETLLESAWTANPDIMAARANVSAAEAGVRMARSAYFPTLSMSAGWSGFAREAGNTGLLIEQARGQMESAREQCIRDNLISEGLPTPLPGAPRDCSRFVLTPQQESAIRADNDVFPFGFSREPFGAQLTLSLPIFQGFDRERQIAQARIAEDDAEHRQRAEELRVRTNVERALLNLRTAREAVALEERNRELADQQLALERERYRVGVASFVELQEAETLKARADRDYLVALYTFHENLTALEAAVGRPLRVNPGEG